MVGDVILYALRFSTAQYIRYKAEAIFVYGYMTFKEDEIWYVFFVELVYGTATWSRRMIPVVSK